MRDVGRLFPVLKQEVPDKPVGEVVEELEVEGWKGKSGCEIIEPSYYGPGQCYLLTEFRKKKLSGEVEEIKTLVPWEFVQKLWELIMDWPVGMIFKPRYLWAKLIEQNNFDVDIDAFNGGRYRSRVYFPYYYYPMKVLEAKGVVIFGHDSIERIGVLKNNGVMTL